MRRVLILLRWTRGGNDGRRESILNSIQCEVKGSATPQEKKEKREQAVSVAEKMGRKLRFTQVLNGWYERRGLDQKITVRAGQGEDGTHCRSSLAWKDGPGNSDSQGRKRGEKEILIVKEKGKKKKLLRRRARRITQ